MGWIRVRGLGKAYKVYPSRWGRLAEWWPGTATPRHVQKWVLRDIDFDVEPGRALGIIGINGAGKSTLLKILTGTTLATEGAVSMEGRVAALLELGMGFHPDFTGRENVRMGGHLLGLSDSQINQLMPDIEAFSEIGAAIGEPVRTYSSGMQMRLAFSLATAVRPDVLIIDEALSVGDAYFQHKSFDRIRAFRQQGTTLLIVSHDKAAIQNLCDEALLLHQGRQAMRGDPESVMDYYNALIAEKEGVRIQQTAGADGRLRTVSGTGEAAVTQVRLLDEAQRPIEVCDVGQPVQLELKVSIHTPLPKVVVGFMIKDRLGQPVFGTNTHHLDCDIEGTDRMGTLTLHFRFQAHLGEGHYSIATAITDSDTHLTRNFEWQDLALLFQVINQSHTYFVGCAHLPTTVEVKAE